MNEEQPLSDLDKRIAQIGAVGTAVDQSGGDAEAEGRARTAAANESTTQIVGRAFRSANAGVELFQYADRFSVEPDPDFDLNAHFAELSKGVPLEWQDRFNSTRSLEEAKMVRADIMKELEDNKVLAGAGVRGMAATGLASIVDVDLPLTLMSEGSYAAGKVGVVTAKAGMAGTRLEKIAKMGAAGAEAGFVTQAAKTAASPTGDWTDVPNATLGGMVFGSVLGTVLPKGSADSAQAHLDGVKAEFNEARTNGFPTKPDERPIRKAPAQETPVAGADSVGAASLRTDKLDPNFRNPTTKELLDEVRQANIRDGLTGDKWDSSSYFNRNPASQAAKHLYNTVSKTPWASDFDRFFNSESVIANRLGALTLESPSGVGQQVNRTSAILMPQYNTAIMAPFAQTYQPAFKMWMREQRSIQPSELAWNDAGARSRFDREVMNELQYRYHDGTSAPTSSAAVRQMADAIDKASEAAVRVAKGEQDEIPAFGAESLEARPGWYRQLWNGININNAIMRAEQKFGAKNGRKLIVRSIRGSYQDLHGWDKELAEKVANAVVTRALAHADGANTNLFRLMNNEDGNYLRQLLEDNGYDPKVVDSLMERIKGTQAERGKTASLKHRNDIDLRTPIKGTDMTLMDLVDTDLNKTWTGYARQMSGTAALARNGIHFHELKSKWIPGIKDELQARNAKALPNGFYEAFESYFSGKAYSGGLNPWVRRIMQVTNLSFLNSLGMTQLGELGASVGAMKLDNFIHSAPKEVRAIFNGKLSPVHEDLKNIDASIIGDHNIYKPHMMLNETRLEDGVKNDLANFTDKILAKGAHVQGYLNGFFKVNQLMQRMSGGMLIRRMGKMANEKQLMSEMRKSSLGFNNENYDAIMKYFKDGTVEFKDGDVVNLNAAKWNPKDWQEFAAIINRNSAQSVQRGLRGEDAWWMHKDTGAFMMHLKSFTFTAMHKQLIRNLRIADAESLATFIYGLGTAAAAYAGRQYTAGNQEKMDGEKLVKGMLNYSNMTSPLIQFTDPMMGVLGLDEFQVGNYGNQYGANTSLLATPPSFTAVNRIAGIPKAVSHGLTGDMNKSDIYSLQATPILGNLYGMGYLANAMRDEIDAKKRAKKKATDKETVKVPVQTDEKPGEGGQ